ncbi:heme-binding protein, partial [Mycolicibacterium hassiacum]
ASLAVGAAAALTLCGGGVAAAQPAGQPPGCTASNFSHTASGVLAAAGAWLDAHPEANDVLTAAGQRGAGAEQSVRDYFVARPQEYQELRAIAAPLIDLQRGCNAAIQPMQIAALYEALSRGGPH